MSDFSIPVAFHFRVSFAGETDVAFVCQEVSGLETGQDVEAVVEGGENRFVHQLPKGVKRPNLKLKRGLSAMNSRLVMWCKAMLEADFAKPVETHDLEIALLDAQGTPVACWKITNAWPVKWQAGAFDAMKNELAVEMIELAYSDFKRTI